MTKRPTRSNSKTGSPIRSIKGSHLVKTAVIMATLSTGACSFKKPVDKKDDVPPTIVVEAPHSTPKNAFEAMAVNNMLVFEQFLGEMTATEINAYQTDGSTLLETAVKLNNYAATEKLLAKGALPLKPRQGTTETPLSLASKTNPSIQKLLETTVQNQKRHILTLTQNKRYSEAHKAFLSFYMNPSEDLESKGNLLDIMIQNETAFSTENLALTQTLANSDVDLSKSFSKAILVSAENRSAFKAILTTGKKQNLKLDTATLTQVLQTQQIDQLEDRLTTIHELGFEKILTLSQMQDILIASLAAEKRKNPFIDIKYLQRVTLLMSKVSTERSFCSTCFETIMKHPNLAIHRGDLMKLLIAGAVSTPSDFVRSLMGKNLSYAELGSILAILPPEYLKTQQEAFSSLEMTDEDYKTISEFGLKMNPDQLLQKFNQLLSDRYARRLTNIPKIFSSLTGDFAVLNGKFTEAQSQAMFDQEFKHVLETDSPSTILPILSQVIETKGRQFSIGNVPTYKPLEKEPETGWFITIPTQQSEHNFESQTGTERLTINPNYLIESILAKNPAEISGPNTLKFFLKDKIDPNRPNWIFKTDSWQLSEHELVWMELLDNEESSKMLLPQIQMPTVKTIIKRYSFDRQFTVRSAMHELATTSRHFELGSPYYLNRYLPALLVSQYSDVKIAVLESLLWRQREIATPSETIHTGLIGRFIEKATDDKVLKLIDPVLSYVLNATPRLRLVIKNLKYLEYYETFLRTAERDNDPLCIAGVLTNQRIVIEGAELTIRNCAKAIENGNTTRGSIGSRDVGQSIKEARRMVFKQQALIQDDLDAINLLRYLHKRTNKSKRLNEMINGNRWILEIDTSTNFFRPDVILEQPARRPL